MNRLKLEEKDKTYFTRIPLLIIKYKISPNVCNPNISYYRNRKFKSNLEFRFNFQTKTRQEVQLETPP